MSHNCGGALSLCCPEITYSTKNAWASTVQWPQLQLYPQSTMFNITNAEVSIFLFLPNRSSQPHLTTCYAAEQHAHISTQKHSSIKQQLYINATTASFIQIWTAVINNSSVATNHYLIHNKVSLPERLQVRLNCLHIKRQSHPLHYSHYSPGSHTLWMYTAGKSRDGLNKERFKWSLWGCVSRLGKSSRRCVRHRHEVARTGLLWERDGCSLTSLKMMNEFVTYCIFSFLPGNEYRVDDREIQGNKHIGWTWS